ncbi:MAG: SGNH/GDSL hydrolase family protein [Candidatus Fimimonas sp.]
MKLKQGMKIVFAGDSVTDDGRARPVGEGLWGALGNGFVRMVDTFLTVDYPELLVRCVNMGTSGDTSKDLLARWDADVVSQKPDLVVLCIGFNDVWRQFDCPAQPDFSVSPEQYRQNLAEMASKTTAQMIWMTPYYLEPNQNDAMRKRMDEYGAICKEEAAKRNVPCIDLQAEFAEILKHRYPAYITWDRVHPGWTGSLIIARALLKELVR